MKTANIVHSEVYSECKMTQTVFMRFKWISPCCGLTYIGLNNFKIPIPSVKQLRHCQTCKTDYILNVE